jgi:hypothetical protein
MPWSQEEAIVLANVAERAERYDDMIEYMKATLRPVGRFRNLKLILDPFLHSFRRQKMDLIRLSCLS